MIEYTDDELKRYAVNDEILAQVIEAERSGDKAHAMELRRKMVYPPAALLGLKESLGADWIREHGLDTTEADRKFGKGWMERDNAELEKLLWS